MYFLYVDESDTSTDEVSASRWYCLCGVRIVDTSYGRATDKLHSLISGWEPPLPRDFELKGIDLFQGGGSWKDRKPDERVDFSKKVATAIGEANLRLYVAMKPSEDFRSDYRFLLDKLIRRATRDVAQQGTKTSKQLLLVFDQRADIAVSESLRQIREEVVADLATSCRFIDHGYEANSRHAPLIQVADFAAYFIRKEKAMTRETTLFSEAEPGIVIDAVEDIVGRMCRRIHSVPVS